MAHDTVTHYYRLPRVEMARVEVYGEQCERHGFHVIPGGTTLTVDLNGAALLCDALLAVVRRELNRRRWVRVIRQSGAPMPEEYLR